MNPQIQNRIKIAISNTITNSHLKTIKNLNSKIKTTNKKKKKKIWFIITIPKIMTI